VKLQARCPHASQLLQEILAAGLLCCYSRFAPDDPAMTSTFGERLRLQREQKQISLAAVAEQTKIKQSLLEALERDDLTHWPLGLFGRSYVRSYAQAIGLDPAATLREFLDRQPGESAAADLTEVGSLAPEKAGRRPPTRLEVLIDSAIDAFHARRTEMTHRSATTPAAPPPPTDPPPAIAYSESVTPPRQRPQLFPAPLEPLPQPENIDLASVAHLCTRLGCAQEAEELTAVLEEAALILDLAGLILWVPDAHGIVLTPVFTHGYPDEVIAQLARVTTDGDNASAESFRSGRMCIVSGIEASTGAIVVPMLTPVGCAGVLAVEVRNGAEQREDLRAALTILAAQVSTLMGFSVLAQTMTA
jgi:transcriptional regulator with XRE-family HTH domain